MYYSLTIYPAIGPSQVVSTTLDYYHAIYLVIYFPPLFLLWRKKSISFQIVYRFPVYTSCLSQFILLPPDLEIVTSGLQVNKQHLLSRMKRRGKGFWNLCWIIFPDFPCSIVTQEKVETLFIVGCHICDSQAFLACRIHKKRFNMEHNSLNKYPLPNHRLRLDFGDK